VWRTAHEPYRPECMTAECVLKVSVMIWGCITWYGVGTLCQVNGNINAEKYILLQSSLNSQPTVFYDIDIRWLGWPYHTMNVVIMLIPLHNPSLIGITNSGQLFDTILDLWQNFNVEYVQNLYQSIPRRVLACIRSKGHITVQSRAKSICGKWRTSRLSCLALAILNLRKSQISSNNFPLILHK
jgi:hypothetical protein